MPSNAFSQATTTRTRSKAKRAYMSPLSVTAKTHKLYVYIMQLYPLEARKDISKFFIKWSDY